MKPIRLFAAAVAAAAALVLGAATPTGEAEAAWQAPGQAIAG